jgi:hypothetical protein
MEEEDSVLVTDAAIILKMRVLAKYWNELQASA